MGKINEIMSKLKKSIPAAKSRAHTHLKVQTRNATIWSSTFEMNPRYRKIREFFSLIKNVDDINELLLTRKENCKIDSLLEDLKDFGSVSQPLRKDDATIFDVRALFDAVSDNYPLCADRSEPDAQIVPDKYFESAVLKIQQGRFEAFSSAE